MITWTVPVNGEQVTVEVPDGYRLITNERSQRETRALLILSDMDRCEHGRHEGDDCFGCGGPSVGNMFVVKGARIGTTLSGSPILIPDPDEARSDRSDATLWGY
jgi:hypothetical protein